MTQETGPFEPSLAFQDSVRERDDFDPPLVVWRAQTPKEPHLLLVRCSFPFIRDSELDVD